MDTNFRRHRSGASRASVLALLEGNRYSYSSKKPTQSQSAAQAMNLAELSSSTWGDADSIYQEDEIEPVEDELSRRRPISPGVSCRQVYADKPLPLLPPSPVERSISRLGRIPKHAQGRLRDTFFRQHSKRGKRILHQHSREHQQQQQQQPSNKSSIEISHPYNFKHVATLQQASIPQNMTESNGSSVGTEDGPKNSGALTAMVEDYIAEVNHPCPRLEVPGNIFRAERFSVESQDSVMTAFTKDINNRFGTWPNTYAYRKVS